MSPTRTAGCWCAVLALLSALVGPARAAAEDSPQPVRRYPLRAEILRLPEKPGGYLTIRHEAVNDFVDVTGDLVGMDSMVMEFPVAPVASLKGLNVGDKIAAVLVVNFARGFGELDQIKKLPRETVLHFGKARSPKKSRPHPDNMNQEKQP